MDELEALLKDGAESEIYVWKNPAAVDDIGALVKRYGYRFFYLDGEQIWHEQDFFDACRTVMNFPGWCGNNWNALNDCIRDLSWFSESGFVLLYDSWDCFDTEDPDNFRIGIDVLRYSTEFRREVGNKPFMVVLLRGGVSDTVDFQVLGEA